MPIADAAQCCGIGGLRNDCGYREFMHNAAPHLPLAINYIDWLPLSELFIVLKILLIPAAVVVALVSRLRERRGGLKAHESRADRDAPRAIWANQALEDAPVGPPGVHPPPPVPPPPGGYPPAPPTPDDRN